MKILFYGHKGWIGKKFHENLLTIPNIELFLSDNRCDDIEHIESDIINYKPSHILITIGRTSGGTINTIDYLQQNDKLQENVKDNLFSPMVMAILSKKYNCHLTYIGTGCIFESYPEGGFTEEDKPNFFGSNYSIVKGFTDQLMHLFDDTVLNLRIRMPITSEICSKNFITKITKYEYICSIPNSMTNLDELIPIAIDLMKNNYTGTINLVNPELISHNEILEMYKEIIDPNFTWKNFTIDEQNSILASKRSNNLLNTDKLVNLYPDIKSIKESVRETLIKMKKNTIIENI